MSEQQGVQPVPPRRMLWTMTALVGVLVLPIIIWLAQLMPASGCGAVALDSAPLTDFQSAKTVDDIVAIFGAPASDCRAELLISVDRINRWDLFAYIPIAALLLVGFLLASRQTERMWAFWIGAAGILLTIAGDVAETSMQLQITSVIARISTIDARLDDNFLLVLRIGNTLKTYGLPIVFAALAAMWWGRGAAANILSCILIVCSASRFAGSLLPGLQSLPLIGGLSGVVTLVVASVTLAAKRWRRASVQKGDVNVD